MKTTLQINRRSAVASLLFMLSFPFFFSSKASAALATAPWPMYGQNLNHTALSPSVAGSTGLLRWKFSADGMINSSPAVGADGTVYFGSDDDNVYAVHPDGTLKWKYPTGGFVYSSPALDSNGTVYIGSLDNYLYAINPDGTLKWRFLAGGSIYSPPAIGTDGTVYAGSIDYNLYAINSDGTLKWKFLTGSIVYSSPAIGPDGTIYTSSFDKNLYAINPSGSLKWSYATNGSSYSSPAIGADGTLYVGSNDHFIYAVTTGGALKWHYETGAEVYASPAIGADGTVYVGSDDKFLYAMNPASGALKWKFQTGGRIGYTALAVGSDNTVYVASEDNAVYAVNNNVLSWKYQMGGTGNRYNSPAISGDGTIYTGSVDHNLYALKVTTPPTLAWTGEANYVTDGLDPEIGTTATPFTFRIKYADADGDAPKNGFPKVHIVKAGAEIAGSPFSMSLESGSYLSGALFKLSKTLAVGGGDYSYYFEASDTWGAAATGAPISPTIAPFVVAMTSLVPSKIYNSNPVTAITINGIGFSSGSTVKLASTGHADVNVANVAAGPTQICGSLDLTGAATGYWDVVISTGGLGSYLAVFPGAFNYKAMAVNSVKPAEGCNTVPMYVKALSGEGFVAGSNIKMSKAGQSTIAATDVALVSDTQFTCKFEITGAATGYWDVTVSTGGTGALSVTLSSGIYVNIIHVESVTPDSGFNNELAWPSSISGAGFATGMTAKLTRTGSADIIASER